VGQSIRATMVVYPSTSLKVGMPMEWPKKLRKSNGQKRKSYSVWQIPKELREKYGWTDSNRLEVNIRVGRGGDGVGGFKETQSSSQAAENSA
jgi:hypothetical protein